MLRANYRMDPVEDSDWNAHNLHALMQDQRPWPARKVLERELGPNI